jgi:hypothetical protein
MIGAHLNSLQFNIPARLCLVIFMYIIMREPLDGSKPLPMIWLLHAVFSEPTPI